MEDLMRVMTACSLVDYSKCYIEAWNRGAKEAQKELNELRRNYHEYCKKYRIKTTKLYY